MNITSVVRFSLTRTFVCALVLAFFLSAPAFASVTLIYPGENTLVNGNSVTLYGYTDEEESFLVQINFLKTVEVESEGFFSVEIELFPGLNVVKAGGEMVKIFSVTGARLKEFKYEVDVEEMLFTSFELHPALDEGCDSCHSLEDGELEIPSDLKGTCFGCHEDFTKNEDGEDLEYVHGPVDEGECLSCHDPHYSRNEKLLTDWPPGKLCIGCHDDKDPGETEKAVIHRAVKDLECQDCHSPHASPYEYQLLEGGNDLCRACHKILHSNHRTAGMEERKTLQIPEDFPREKEGDFSCLGCHRPHFSENARLFRLPEAQLCLKCHKL